MTNKSPEDFITDLKAALPDNNPDATVPATFRQQFEHLKDSILFRANAVDLLDAILESDFWRKTELIIDDIEGLTAALEDIAGSTSLSLNFRGDWDASTGEFPYGGGGVFSGYMYRVSVAGTVDTVDFQPGDYIFALINSPSAGTFTGNWHHIKISSAVAGVTGIMVHNTAWSPASGAFPGSALKGYVYRVNGSGSFSGVNFYDGDYLIASIDSPSITTFANNWELIRSASSRYAPNAHNHDALYAPISSVTTVGIVTVNASRALAASDAGKVLRVTADATLTVNDGVFAAGQIVTIRVAGTNVTATIADGTATVTQTSGATKELSSDRSQATLHFVDSANADMV